MYLRTYVKLFLHKSLVGDANFAAWRLFVSTDGEIDRLPFAKYYKAHYRKHLKKAKIGLAIDDWGSASLIDDLGQIISAQILPA
ncbi:hypothetical protein EFB08_17690 [Rufibacter latericius]|uniref:Uncharacterized protein n=2 Tax=Rufibacter latericius TaxID=2487040 RepID=A0A3M9MCU0_9BACT|nr:hypothetical protein EFB08_17690 [Rufibacter latericius]